MENTGYLKGGRKQRTFVLLVTLGAALLVAFGVVLSLGTTRDAQAIGSNAVRSGFNDNVLNRNDDNSTTQVPLNFSQAINFFGQDYSSLYVNNNGNVTFDQALGTYTPFNLSSTSRVIIAPFFGDVDTRAAGTQPVTYSYGQSSVDGRDAFGVNWVDVGYFNQHADKLNNFQLVLIDRSDINPGDFDIEFNYDRIQWETGDASGGSSGLGGNSARAGFSNGTNDSGTSYELPGSAVNGAFLDSNTANGLIHNSQDSSQPGRYIFEVRNGQVSVPPSDTQAPDVPTLDLDASSDSGVSDSDDKTKDNTPTFLGTAEADSMVKVYDGSSPLGETTTNGSGDWSFTVGGTGSAQGVSELSSGTHSIKATATDASNNTSADSSLLSILVDTAAPTVSFSGGINNNDSFYYGEVPAAPTCSGDDGTGGSGLDGSCTVSGYNTAVGSYTLTGKQKDVAGNEGTAQRSYSVLGWTIKGFYQPVDMSTATTTVYNNAKNGSTVPLKFEVFKGSTELTNTNVVSSFTQKTDCVSGVTEDSIEQYASGSTSLRYDTTSGQFIFNWQTPKAPGACYKVTMTTQDGSSISAYFKLK